MKTQKEAIVEMGKKSGIRKWHSYMSGAMISQGLDIRATAELIAFIYGDDQSAIESEIYEVEDNVYDCLITTGGRVGSNNIDAYLKKNLGI